MNNYESRLRELLSYYGSDLEQWPEELRPLWLRAQHNPKLASIVEEERRFEHLLRKRSFTPPSFDFAERIIAASIARPQRMEAIGWFSDLLQEVRPAALAAMLLLGFAIGFGMLTPPSSLNNTAFVRALTDDEGTIL